MQCLYEEKRDFRHRLLGCAGRGDAEQLSLHPEGFCRERKGDKEHMKANYKNWVPKGMILAFFGVALLLFILAAAAGCLVPTGMLRALLLILLIMGGLIFFGLGIWSLMMYRAFDYNGTRQMARQIIEGTASYVKLPEGGSCLDIGCGSGALGIAVAKRNPGARVIGIDRWGREYASFSKALCEGNAEAEGVSNICFRKGDALHLDFPDESFDAVTSNYVYHNIPSHDRQAILLETLRTLKKGGSFAIHDIFSVSKYGDMKAFLQRLRDMGYQRAELIDTTQGMFMEKREASWMALSGSAILTGVK